MKPTPVQLPDREHAERVRDRDGEQDQRPANVGRDEDRTPAEAVHPDARGQAEQDEGQELDRHQQAELERADAEHVRRDERHRQLRHLCPDLADGLGAPQADEVRVAEEAMRRGGHRPSGWVGGSGVGV